MPVFPKNFIGAIADEVAKTVAERLPHMLPKKRSNGKKTKKLENAIFLDTSAIIDGRIFDVISIGFFINIFAIPQSILGELKHIADSQDMVKKERGRRGLERLEKLKKSKGIKFVVLADEYHETAGKRKDVDEGLLRMAKSYKGRIITCDYNLEKKATIEGIRVINVNALANVLKVSAVPGESLHIKVLHVGKDVTQGVGYLDDGTMIVVEQGVGDIEKMVDVVISRVIQTTAGRILFAKKI